MLAVFNELAQVGESRVLGVGVLLDDGHDRVDNTLLVLESAVVAQHLRQECHHHRVFAWIAGAE